MPCNPSIGGPAKAQLATEVDALGGAMGRVVDETAAKGYHKRSLYRKRRVLRYQVKRGQDFRVTLGPKGSKLKTSRT